MPNWKKVVVSGSDAILNSVTASFTGSFTGTLIGTASQALTASFVNTLNQNVLITGSLTVGATTLGANENTLVLGPAPAGGTGEGGQILLQAPGGTYTSASMWDNWQNNTRLLRGTNASSDAVVAQFNMHSKQVQFPAYNTINAFTGSAAAFLAVDSSGNLITTSSAGGGGSTTINNNVDNYIITATGTVNTLNGESNLQFNGSSLTVTGEITSSGAIRSLANGAMYFRGGDDAEFWDINLANHVGIYGQQDQGIASIKLGSGGGIVSGRSSSIGINITTPNSGALHISGGVFATSFTGSFTGSLTGTASYADRATSASISDTASYVVSASYASTSSWASGSLSLGATIGQNAAGTIQLRNSVGTTISSINVNTITASLAFTASYLNPGNYGITASWATSSLTASYVTGSIFTSTNPAGTAIRAGSASFAETASFLNLGTYAITSSWAVSASQAISASRATTSSFAISASWAPGGGGSAFPYTGSAQITGSLGITGSLLVQSPTLGGLNTAATALFDSGQATSIDWGLRAAYAPASGPIVIDWSVNQLYDTNGSPSIDWENRILTEPGGTWTAFEYSNNTATISQLYHRTVIPGQVQRSIAETPIYAGQLLQATIDVGVTDYQLVFLDTDGTWKGTKATAANGANKMLGIAVDVAGGYVLIEGDVGVSDDNSQGGYVVGADHGLPVYVSGTTGVMTTTAPSGTGELVRIVGHIYYQSTTDTNWWTMKFRPSNDWYEQ